MKLLMAVKSVAPHCRREIDCDFPEAFHQNDVFHDSSGQFAVDVRQLEGIAVKVDRVRIVGAIFEGEPIALAF